MPELTFNFIDKNSNIVRTVFIGGTHLTDHEAFKRIEAWYERTEQTFDYAYIELVR